METYQPLNDDDFARYREMKEQATADMEERGTHDIAPILELWRDGAPFLTIWCPQIDRDMALAAAQHAVPRTNADRLVVMMDAHVTDQMVNPATGEEWQHGEMQKACDQDGACDVGTITDCLNLVDMGRDGTARMNALTYHVDKDAKEVHWGRDFNQTPDGESSEGIELQGTVPDALRYAFSIDPETVHAPRPEELQDLPEQTERALKDAQCLIELTMSGYGAGFFYSEEKSEYFAEVNEILKAFMRVSEKMTGQSPFAYMSSADEDANG